MAYVAFGQVTPVIAAAVVNTGILATTAYQADKLNVAFQQQLQSQAATKEYISNLLLKMKSSAMRIADTGTQPGTYDFEKSLQQAMLQDMVYKGGCNADIYVPNGPQYAPGKPRPILGTLLANGVVQAQTPTLAAEVGPYWSAQCKNLHDDADVEFLKKYKDNINFQRQRTQISDIGSLKLLLKYGLGIFILVLMGLTISTQRKVIKKQTTSS